MFNRIPAPISFLSAAVLDFTFYTVFHFPIPLCSTFSLTEYLLQTPQPHHTPELPSSDYIPLTSLKNLFPDSNSSKNSIDHFQSSNISQMFLLLRLFSLIHTLQSSLKLLSKTYKDHLGKSANTIKTLIQTLETAKSQYVSPSQFDNLSKDLSIACLNLSKEQVKHIETKKQLLKAQEDINILKSECSAATEAAKNSNNSYSAQSAKLSTLYSELLTQSQSDKSTFNSQLQEKNNQISQLQSTIQNLETEKLSQSKIISDLSSKLKVAEESNVEQNQSCSQLKAKNVSLVASIGSLTQSHLELKQKYSDLQSASNDEITALKSENIAFQQSKLKLESENAALESNTKSLTNQLSEQKQFISSLSSSKTDSITLLENTITSKQAKIDKLLSTLSLKENFISSLKSEQLKQNSKYETKIQFLNTQNSQLETSFKQFVQYQREFVDSLSNIDLLQNIPRSTEKLLSQLSIAREYSSSLELNLGLLYDQYSNTVQDFLVQSQKFTLLSATHTDLVSKHENTCKQLGSIQKEFQNLKTLNQDLERKFSKTQDAFSILQLSQTQLVVQHENLSSQNTNLSSQYEKLTLQHDKLTLEHTDLSSQHDTLTSQHEKLTSQHKQLTLKHDSLTSEHKQLEENLLSLQNEKDSISNSHSSLSKEKSSLDANLASASAANLLLTSQNENLSQANSDLESNLSSLKTQYSNLNSQHKSLESDNSTLKHKISNLEKVKTSLLEEKVAMSNRCTNLDEKFSLLKNKHSALHSSFQKNNKTLQNLKLSLKEWIRLYSVLSNNFSIIQNDMQLWNFAYDSSFDNQMKKSISTLQNDLSRSNLDSANLISSSNTWNNFILDDRINSYDKINNLQLSLSQSIQKVQQLSSENEFDVFVSVSQLEHQLSESIELNKSLVLSSISQVDDLSQMYHSNIDLFSSHCAELLTKHSLQTCSNDVMIHEISLLMMKIKNLKSGFEECVEQSKTLFKSELDSSIARFEVSQKESTSKYNLILKENSELKKQIQSLKKLPLSLNKKIANLKGQIVDINLDRKNEISLLQSQKLDAETLSTTLKDGLGESLVQLENTVSVHSNILSQNSGYIQEISTLTDQTAQDSKTISLLRSEISNSAKQIASLKADRVSNQTFIQTLTKQLEQKVAENSKLLASVAASNQKVSTLQNTASCLQETIDDQKDRIETLEQVVQECNSFISQQDCSKKSDDLLCQTFIKQIAALSELQADFEQITQSLANFSQTYPETIFMSLSCQAKLKYIEPIFETQKNLVESLQQDNSILTARNTKNSIHIAHLEKQITILTDKARSYGLIAKNQKKYSSTLEEMNQHSNNSTLIFMEQYTQEVLTNVSSQKKISVLTFALQQSVSQLEELVIALKNANKQIQHLKHSSISSASVTQSSDNIHVVGGFDDFDTISSSQNEDLLLLEEQKSQLAIKCGKLTSSVQTLHSEKLALSKQLETVQEMYIQSQKLLSTIQQHSNQIETSNSKLEYALKQLQANYQITKKKYLEQSQNILKFTKQIAPVFENIDKLRSIQNSSQLYSRHSWHYLIQSLPLFSLYSNLSSIQCKNLSSVQEANNKLVQLYSDQQKTLHDSLIHSFDQQQLQSKSVEVVRKTIYSFIQIDSVAARGSVHVRNTLFYNRQVSKQAVELQNSMQTFLVENSNKQNNSENSLLSLSSNLYAHTKVLQTYLQDNAKSWFNHKNSISSLMFSTSKTSALLHNRIYSLQSLMILFASNPLIFSFISQINQLANANVALTRCINSLTSHIAQISSEYTIGVNQAKLEQQLIFQEHEHLQFIINELVQNLTMSLEREASLQRRIKISNLMNETSESTSHLYNNLLVKYQMIEKQLQDEKFRFSEMESLYRKIFDKFVSENTNLIQSYHSLSLQSLSFESQLIQAKTEIVDSSSNHAVKYQPLPPKFASILKSYTNTMSTVKKLQTTNRKLEAKNMKLSHSLKTAKIALDHHQKVNQTIWNFIKLVQDDNCVLENRFLTFFKNLSSSSEVVANQFSIVQSFKATNKINENKIDSLSKNLEKVRLESSRHIQSVKNNVDQFLIGQKKVCSSSGDFFQTMQLTMVNDVNQFISSINTVVNTISRNNIPITQLLTVISPYEDLFEINIAKIISKGRSTIIPSKAKPSLFGSSSFRLNLPLDRTSDDALASARKISKSKHYKLARKQSESVLGSHSVEENSYTQFKNKFPRVKFTRKSTYDESEDTRYFFTPDSPSVYENIDAFATRDTRLPYFSQSPPFTKLPHILKDPWALETVFGPYLDTLFSRENLLFWLRVEKFRLITSPPDRLADAWDIYVNFIEPGKAQYEINIMSGCRRTLMTKIEGLSLLGSNYVPSQTDIPISLFDEAQWEIYDLLNRDCLPRFLKTTNFKRMVKSAGAKYSTFIDPELLKESRTKKAHATALASVPKFIRPGGFLTLISSASPISAVKKNLKQSKSQEFTTQPSQIQSARKPVIEVSDQSNTDNLSPSSGRPRFYSHSRTRNASFDINRDISNLVSPEPRSESPSPSSNEPKQGRLKRWASLRRKGSISKKKVNSSILKNDLPPKP